MDRYLEETKVQYYNRPGAALCAIDAEEACILLVSPDEDQWAAGIWCDEVKELIEKGWRVI